MMDHFGLFLNGVIVMGLLFGGVSNYADEQWRWMSYIQLAAAMLMTFSSVRQASWMSKRADRREDLLLRAIKLVERSTGIQMRDDNGTKTD